jgi:hypothetical protein
MRMEIKQRGFVSCLLCGRRGQRCFRPWHGYYLCERSGRCEKRQRELHGYVVPERETGYRPFDVFLAVERQHAC